MISSVYTFPVLVWIHLMETQGPKEKDWDTHVLSQILQPYPWYWSVLLASNHYLPQFDIIIDHELGGLLLIPSPLSVPIPLNQT